MFVLVILWWCIVWIVWCVILMICVGLCKCWYNVVCILNLLRNILVLLVKIFWWWIWCFWWWVCLLSLSVFWFVSVSVRVLCLLSNVGFIVVGRNFCCLSVLLNCVNVLRLVSKRLSLFVNLELVVKFCINIWEWISKYVMLFYFVCCWVGKFVGVVGF